MGERTPLALIDAPASGRMAVGEAITNIAAAPIASSARRQALRQLDGARRASGRGRGALRHRARRRDRHLRARSASRFRSARTRCRCARRGATDGDERAVTAPVSLIVSAFAPVARRAPDAHAAAALDAGDTSLVLVDLARGRRRLGGSALAQVYGQLGNEAPDLDDPDRARRLLRVRRAPASRRAFLAYHDVADGGLFATLARDGVRSHRCGLDVTARRRRRRRAAAGALRRGSWAR